MNTWPNSISPLAKRVAARWLRAEKNVVTQLKSGLEKDEMAAWSKAAQEYAGKVREYLPDLDKAHTSAIGDLEKAISKLPKSSHPRVDGYEAQELQSIVQTYLEDMRAAKQKFDEAIMAKLQEFTPKSESVEE
jgi:1,4-dihydroxy-2-naphthoyl-CoA synthase